MSRLPLVAFVLALAAGWYYYQWKESEAPPVECSCVQLANHPTTYAGKVVRVSTAGTEPGPHNTLVWWRMAGDPPAVVLRGAIPDPVPPFLTGTCHAPLAGGPVVVSDCRP